MYDAFDQRHGPVQGHGPQELARKMKRDEHYAAHRFRCGACKGTFCDVCKAMPYHTGYTCDESAAPDCIYCGDKVLHARGGEEGDQLFQQMGKERPPCYSPEEVNSWRIARLRDECGKLQIDTSW